VFVGAGTELNVVTVLVGSSLGSLLGARLRERTRDVVTDALGLVTLLLAALSAAQVTDPALARVAGTGAPVLIVLAATLLGGIVGSVAHLEERLTSLGGRTHRLLTARGRSGAGGRERFVEGFVSASLVFCVGPLTILGALSDGLGHGIEQLTVKSVLDGFTAIAFAASLGWGVAASALTVAVVQGSLTLVGLALGDVLSAAQVAALTATGGLLLAGVGLRLLRVRDVAVADLLPALVLAPLLVPVAAAVSG
jgi:uncharacterized membrane protein YqgA involved in biofilm formation